MRKRFIIKRWVRKATAAGLPRLGGHPLLKTWESMIARCHNPGHHSFARYGGRGISVCDWWRYDFWAFVADMGSRPSTEHSLDRIDNDGNYEPGNVRWATRREQAANKEPAVGERHGLAKLTDDSVFAIRRLLPLKIFGRAQLARWFHVDPKTIANIRDGLIWRHVP